MAVQEHFGEKRVVFEVGVGGNEGQRFGAGGFNHTFLTAGLSTTHLTDLYHNIYYGI